MWKTALLLGVLTLLPSPAQATLQAALSLDGGGSLLACDQNLCAGGAVPTLLDADPAIGVLTTLPNTIGAIQASFAIQTATILNGLSTLSSAGTVVQNTDTVPHAFQLTIGATDFPGPATFFTATGSGTWVDQTLPIAFGGTTITMTWFDDPANTQGAEFAGDTPGILLSSVTDTPPDGVNNQSFSHNVSGSVLDPADFSMTLDNVLTLGPGIRLESRGQALAKETAAVVPNPMPALLLGLGMAGLVVTRRVWRF